MKILLEVCWRQVVYITKMFSIVFNRFPNLWKQTINLKVTNYILTLDPVRMVYPIFIE